MPAEPPAEQPHRARRIAESFGADPDRYDRTRPRYPRELLTRILTESPGPDVLDVGIGTGIAARALRAAGARVLGVDVDPRMAANARERGLDVEVAKFEDWDPAGRTFDAVLAAQTWHWVDPVAGPVRAARVLRPGGRLAVFWNVFRPAPGIAEAFTAVYRRVVPDLPRNPWAHSPLEAYSSIFDAVAAGIARTEAFDATEQWQVDWERRYSRDEWLDQVPTHGDSSQLSPDTLAELLAGIGAVIDAAGGSFAMGYAAVAVTALTRR